MLNPLDKLTNDNSPLPLAANTPTSGITEIVLAHANSLSLVLPSLAFLSHQSNDRWLTWLPPAGITKSLLQQYGFEFSRTRFVYPKNDEHAFWLFWQALAEGNSHMVVGTPGCLGETQLARLEHAAIVGNCSGLILRDRSVAH